MAYKKIYRKSKQTKSVRQVANKALTLAKKAISTEETKFSDIGTISASVDNTADVVHLTPIAQGTALNNRIGNKISALGFQFNFWAFKNASATNSQLRIVFVHDTQQVADTSPTWTSAFVEEFVTTQRQIGLANKRYRILYDTTLRLDVGNPSSLLHKKFISFKHPVMYNGTAGSDIQKNGVYMMVLSNESTNLVAFNYSIRFMYKDS